MIVWVSLVTRIVLLLAGVPALVFWALMTLNPRWIVPLSWRTILAFWIVYVAVRLGVQTIRYSEWMFEWSWSSPRRDSPTTGE